MELGITGHRLTPKFKAMYADPDFGKESGQSLLTVSELSAKFDFSKSTIQRHLHINNIRAKPTITASGKVRTYTKPGEPKPKYSPWAVEAARALQKWQRSDELRELIPPLVRAHREAARQTS